MDLYYVKHDLDKSEFTVLRAEVIDDTSYDTLIKVRISNDIEGEWVSKDLLYEDRIDAVNAFKTKIETLYGKLTSYRNTVSVGGRGSMKDVYLDIAKVTKTANMLPLDTFADFIDAVHGNYELEEEKDGED